MKTSAVAPSPFCHEIERYGKVTLVDMVWELASRSRGNSFAEDLARTDVRSLGEIMEVVDEVRRSKRIVTMVQGMGK